MSATQIGAEFAKRAALQRGVKLRPHQDEAVESIDKSPGGTLLYMGIGSGKTLAAVAAKEKLGLGPANVVVPAALRSNFTKQLNRFSTAPDAREYNVQSLNAAAKGALEPRDTLIVDEVQRLRNQGEGYKPTLQAAAAAKKRILLSGTPLVNAPEDMASIINLLHGKQMYDPQQFEKKFVHTKTHTPWFGKGYTETNVQNEHALRKLLHGRVNYMANDVSTTPKVTAEDVSVPMSKTQERLTRGLEDSLPLWAKWKYKKNLPPDKAEAVQLNAFLSGMRQVALSPHGFDKRLDDKGAFDNSPKLQRALQDLQETLKKDPSAKVMAYSNFIDAGLKPYASALEKAKVPYAMFTGNMGDAAKAKAVEDYNAGRSRAVLVGPAGSEGISLKGTNLVQMLDHHWNQARSDQAQGRAVRLDSHLHLPIEDRNVTVRHYMAHPHAGFFQRLFGRTPMNVDDYLASRSKEKQQSLEKFLDILRSEGSHGRIGV